MTPAELAKVIEATRLLMCGRTDDAKTELLTLIFDAGGTVPTPPPDATPPEPRAAA